jgi:predicted extracellular nuclease
MKSYFTNSSKLMCFLITIVLIVTCQITKVNAQVTQLSISQVYGGGGNSGSIYKNDFIEIFNRGNIAVSLSGLSVQYASSIGTSWQVTTLPSFTLQPGQYFLVQEAAGAGGTTNLPTPDAIGTIAMGAAAGKVALVNSTVALSGACPTTNVIDKVGFGTGTDCFEGTGPTANLSAANSASRLSNGCTDLTNNPTDFSIGAAAPRNSASPLQCCSAPFSITCPSNITTTTSGSCGANVTYPAATATGVLPVITYSHASGSLFPIGTTTVTATATNSCGSINCTFTVTVNSPEINITGNSVTIVDGDITPDPADHTDFGNVTVGGNLVRTYTIQNLGMASLNVSGISSTNTLFNAGALSPSGAIAPSASANFTVTFAPTATGTETSIITVNNDDCNEAVYDFTVQGTGGSACIAPVVSCPGTINVNNNANQCGANVTFSASATGSPAPSIVYSIPSGSFFPVGNTLVSATATNSCGTDVCNFTVTVTDNQAPSISCPSTINVNATSGSGAVVTYVAPVGSDNCPGAVTIRTAGFASGSTFPIGSTTVTHQVTDAGGLTAQCSFTVNVIAAAPVIVCPGNISINNTTGSCGANVSFVATETTGIPASTINYSIAPGSFFNVGTVAVTATATNAVGTSSCTFNVTVSDNQPPVAICQNVTVILNSSGTGTITAAQVNNNSTDNCSIVNYSLNRTTFNCIDVGGTVAVANGLIFSEYVEGSASNKYIEIFNGTGSSVNLANYELRLFANGASAVTTTNVLSGTLANGATIVYRNSAATIYAGASTIASAVNWNGDDAIGLFNTVTGQYVDIFGRIGDDPGTAWTGAGGYTTVDKTLRRKATILSGVTTNPSGTGVSAFTTLTTEWDLFNIDDVSGLGAHTFTPPVVPVSVVLTVTDAAGLSSACTSIVTVIDNLPPSITTCAPNQDVNLNANCSLVVPDLVAQTVASDNCSVSVMQSPVAGTVLSSSHNQTHLVTLTATDAAGLTATCQTTLTGKDVTPPTAVCQNLTVPLNASGQATITAAQVNNGSSDNCGTVSLSLNQTSFNCSNLAGAPLVATGLIFSEYVEGSSSNKYIEIFNGTGTSVNLANYELRLFANGSATATTTNVLSGTLANGATIVYRNSAATIFAGTSTALTSVNWNGDDAIGLFNTVTGQYVDIFGRIGDDPGTAWTGAGGYTTVDKTLRRKPAVYSGVVTNPVGTGISAFTTLTTEWDLFNIDDVTGLGAHTFTPPSAPLTVVLTVTDGAGLTSTCTSNITVVDNLPPSISVCAPNQDVNLNANCSLVVPNLISQTIATDNCSVTLTQSPVAGTVLSSSHNQNHSVIITATDGSGLTATCTVILTGKDVTPPTAVCQNVTVTLNAAGTGTLTAAQVNNGSIDNCGIASLSLSQTTFNCANIGGASAITDLFISEYIEGSSNNKCIEIYNGTGAAVNLAAGGYQLKYYFNGALTAGLTIPLTGTVAAGDVYVVCQSTSAANFLAQADQTNTSSWYNGDDAIELVKNSGATTLDIFGKIGEDPGTNWGVTPLSTLDQTLRRNATVTSGVTVNPALGFPSLATQWTGFPINDDTGLGSHTVAAGSGVVPVTLTVTDINGLVSTCTANVTVQDLTPPTVITQHATINLNAAGNASITAAQINNGSNDACGIGNISLTPTNFTCANIGPNTVTLTVTDINGNVNTGTAVVTVVDNVAPTAICQNVTVILDANGNGSITAAQVNNGSFDNCGSVTVAVSPSTFNCSNIGSGSFPTDLIISEYVEGTSNNKAIELYNGTGSPINLSASGYALRVYSNGSLVPSSTTGLVGIIPNGGTFVIANNAAVAAITSIANQLSGNINFNGNDAVELTKAGNTIDVFGSIGDNPATEWGTGLLSTADNTVRRKSTVLNGVTSNPVGFPGLATNWNGFTTDDFSGLGTHSVTTTGNVVTLTATDASGNVGTCFATVTVVDNTNPVITLCAPNQNVNLNGSCGLVVPNLVALSTATDNCTATLTQSPLAGTVLSSSHGQTHNVVITATDAAGNAVTCTTVLTGVDNTNPVITVCAPNQNVNLNGSCGLVVPNLVALSTATDNCTVTLTQSPLAGTVLASSHGQTHNVVITATDAAGNAVTCTTVLTGVDNTNPVITLCAPNQNVNLNGSCGLVVPNLVALSTATDNCTVTLTQSPLAGTVLASSHGQTHNVVITSTDAAGNAVTCTTVLTGVDNTNPVITLCAPNQNVNVDANCALTVPNLVAQSSATDNCTVTLTQSPLAGTVLSSSHGQTHNVVITATDAAGNAVTCTTVLTGKDVTAPSITCNNGSITKNNDPGICGSVVIYNAPTALDNCSINIQQTAGLTSGSVFPVGTTTNTFVVTDAANNSATCSFTVTIIDNEKPVFSNVPANFSACNNPGISWTPPTVTDNCSAIKTSNYAPGFTFPAGSTTVWYYAIDPSGNKDSVSFVVTVLTPSTAPTGITSNRDYNNICSGESITLTVAGGTFGAGGVYKWYSGSTSGSCCTTPVPGSTGLTSITVNPSVSTYYFARIEGTCNATATAMIYVQVSSGSPSGAITYSVLPAYGAPGITDVISVNPVPGATFYQWFTNNGQINGVLFNNNISPVQTVPPTVNISFVLPQQNYQIRVIAGNACGRTGQSNATIRGTVPAPTSLTGPTTACPGQVSSYTVAAVPNNSPVTYNWVLNPASAGTISGTGLTRTVTFSASFSGTATLCVSGVSSFGLVGPPLCITITNNSPAPGLISGQATPCQNGTETYSIVSVGGATQYQWTTSVGTFSPAAPNGLTATIVFPGSAFVNAQIGVRAYNASCGWSSYTYKTVNSATPQVVGVITGPTSGVCLESNKQYSVVSNGATSYAWSLPAGVTVTPSTPSNQNSINVDFGPAFTSGAIQVTATDGCGSSTSPALNINGAPTVPSINSSAVCPNTQATYTATSPGATQYNWTVTGANISGCDFGTTPCSVYTVDWGSGSLSLSVTASNTCGTSSALTLTSCARIAEGNLESKVYPNPTNGKLTIDFQSINGGSYNVSVTDLSGRVVLGEEFKAVSGMNRHEIDLGFVNAGIYMLYVKNADGNNSVTKVVVE